MHRSGCASDSASLRKRMATSSEGNEYFLRTSSRSARAEKYSFFRFRWVLARPTNNNNWLSVYLPQIALKFLLLLRCFFDVNKHVTRIGKYRTILCVNVTSLNNHEINFLNGPASYQIFGQVCLSIRTHQGLLTFLAYRPAGDVR